MADSLLTLLASNTTPAKDDILYIENDSAATGAQPSQKIVLNDLFIGNVKHYGAIGDGVTDDSAAIQATVDANDFVWFPKGDYLCDSIITLRSNLTLMGEGIDIVRIIKNADNGVTEGVLFADSGSSSVFITNITIRDLTVDGLVATKSFSEFRHLISINGVKDVLIERVKFLGYRGDGCYIGSGVGAAERHNTNVTVQHCIFDGVNSDNRNGVTVIDCDGVKILYNTFRDTSRTTMPGAIDVEPDSDFNIAKNIEIIGNHIESYTGTHAIAVSHAVVLTTKMFGVTIKDNYITGATRTDALGIFVRTQETISSATAPMGVEISGNEVIDSESITLHQFEIRNIRDIKVTNNTFSGGSFATVGIGNDASVTAYDVVVENNTFYQLDGANGALLVASVDNLTINGNTFDSPVFAIRFRGSGVTTVSSNVQITNNTFIKGGSQTVSIGVSSHTLAPETNTSYGNRVVGGVLTDEFNTVLTFTSADTTPTVAGNDTIFSNATGVTITRFDDGIKGQKMDIISKGATVYDTSTATRLIGSSVDITTADGDITSWVCETGGTTGSVWRLTGFVDVSVDNSAGA